MDAPTLNSAPPPADPRVVANIIEPTWESWLLGLRQAVQSAYRPRFSILKAKQFILYTQTISTIRQVFVVCVAPLPGIFALLVVSLIPLHDPTLGVQGNPGFLAQLFFGVCLTAASAVITARDVTDITQDEYPNGAVAVVAVLTAVLVTGVFALLGLYWRFPTPFVPVLLFVPWLMSITFAHTLILRKRLKSRRLRNHLLLFLPSLSVQVSQLVLYPTYSALFNASGQWFQAVLIVLLPVLKFILKKHCHRDASHP